MNEEFAHLRATRSPITSAVARHLATLKAGKKMCSHRDCIRTATSFRGDVFFCPFHAARTGLERRQAQLNDVRR